MNGRLEKFSKRTFLGSSAFGKKQYVGVFRGLSQQLMVPLTSFFAHAINKVVMCITICFFFSAEKRKEGRTKIKTAEKRELVEKIPALEEERGGAKGIPAAAI